MGRRIGLGLLVASALLLAPGAATAAPLRPVRLHQQDAGRVAHQHATAEHATLGRVAMRAVTGRERRAQHHPSASPGLFGGAHRIEARLTRALLDAGAGASSDGPRPSSRPRAPPAAV